MELNQIRRNKSSDLVFNAFTLEYSKYIPEDLDLEFTNLINNLYEYHTNQTNTIPLIKANLKNINIDRINFNVKTKLIDFNGNAETNYRLSILLPKIVKMRLLAYQKAYYISGDIILGDIPDYKLYEDFLLSYKVMETKPLANFYADLRIYLNDNNLNRFYNECELLDLVIKALEGEKISLPEIEQLESKLSGKDGLILDYLKTRFIPRNNIKKRVIKWLI